MFCASEPTAKAKSMLGLSLVKMLLHLENQLAECCKRIEELFRSHPDHDMLRFLSRRWTHSTLTFLKIAVGYLKSYDLLDLMNALP
jgi:hypothetical protein